LNPGDGLIPAVALHHRRDGLLVVRTNESVAFPMIHFKRLSMCAGTYNFYAIIRYNLSSYFARCGRGLWSALVQTRGLLSMKFPKRQSYRARLLTHGVTVLMCAGKFLWYIFREQGQTHTKKFLCKSTPLIRFDKAAENKIVNKQIL
jgi:hypothetical protein